MKKHILTAIIAAMTITASAIPALAQSGQISEAQAKQIALQNAGLKESDVTFVRTGMDMDDGRMEYEIEFYCGNMEYDYDIDAMTGAIVSMDQDAEYYAPGAPAAGTAAASGAVTKQQALEIAMKQAGVSKESVTFSRVHRDFDDGREVFDVDFNVGMTEYSFNIDARTGAIVDYDMDFEDDYGMMDYDD